MPPHRHAQEVGRRIAYQRRTHRMTQQQLADAAGIHVGTLRKIERGARGARHTVLDAIADVLGVDVEQFRHDRECADTLVRRAMPALSAALSAYDDPDGGPVREPHEVSKSVSDLASWRLDAQYVRIMRHGPALLIELLRALAQAPTRAEPELARQLVHVCRALDAAAYKYDAVDLSARLIDLMRWAAARAQDPLLDSVVAYVRAETHFAARAHAAGQRALERAIDATPSPTSTPTAASRGALHMRAAVIAGRAGQSQAAASHLRYAAELAGVVPEHVYQGTAFGPDSVMIHEVSLAVSLGESHLARALDIAREWSPPHRLPAERRSGFHIEVARAQLWAGRPDDAFESLKLARRIAPQHVRGHQWVREDVGTLRRLKRADAESLTTFAEWCGAT